MREGRFGLQRLALLVGVPLVAIVGGGLPDGSGPGNTPVLPAP